MQPDPTDPVWNHPPPCQRHPVQHHRAYSEVHPHLDDVPFDMETGCNQQPYCHREISPTPPLLYPDIPAGGRTYRILDGL